ncbi:hypothetical protein [Amycolatopsis sp. WAC 01376]|uniref:hypothetical protein n=1 Tax=Amycolatopsis sp. WAC 01376 TaxID=2203195 RepID=UPI000F773D71|nr:hypothetical protein [Amycolatopsis sp. WAC 01376]
MTYSPSDLDVIEQRFLALAAEPRALTLDCAAIGCGLPAEAKSVDEVRVLLLKRQTSWVTKNAVWQDLVRRAHATPEPWTIVATAMMMPGLKHIGGKLRARYPGDRNDLDSEILEGFLQALDVADDGVPKVYGQLYWAAFRRAHEACNRETRLAMTRSELSETIVAPNPALGHPDLVLADAMLSGAVTPAQADLVSDVLLDHDERSAAAERLGISRYQVSCRLDAATRRLASYLSAGPDAA